MNEAAVDAEGRRVALADVLHGRTRPEPTPTRAGTGGFDGGARMPVPLPRDPLRDHDDLIVALALHSRAFGSYGGW